MKKIIGILAAIFVIALTVLGILALWGIYPFSWNEISKTTLTVILICFGLLLLYIILYNFFRNEKKNFDYTKGNKAHPKI
ncbi:MAG: outer membrane assembly protein [Dysgonamonadaceae bacterium]|jgi:uncharacterized membrane protein|nr:outer membrane assembly protein [Dysgonamonadaceae bacterium]